MAKAICPPPDSITDAPADVHGMLSSFPDVVEELQRRQADSVLRQKVTAYLQNDIPEYFSNGPVLYLARHIATPNFETLRFLHLTESIPLQVVVGQDVKDKFVPINPLKKALGKLPICTSITQKECKVNEQFQNISIIDFNTSSGKSFSDITTVWGEPLVAFHAELLQKLSNRSVIIANDDEWIDRTHRGDLLNHYKKFLALFIVHGVLFEDYIPEDAQEAYFITTILKPAVEHIREVFGVSPLISQLNPKSIESSPFWISYPKEVLSIVTNKMTTQI